MKPFESLPPEQGTQSFEDRLTSESLERLQAEAAARPRPVRFLAGLEMEVEYIEREQGVPALDHPVYDRVMRNGPQSDNERKILQDRGWLYPTPDMLAQRLSPAEVRQWRVRQRRKARSFVEGLIPQTAAEAQRKEAWLDDVEEMDTVDLINFATYDAFSVGTLGETAPPVGISYAEQQAHTERSGWLEFRFGKQGLQAGYYDNPGMSELRLQPCPPDVLAQREAAVTEYMLRLGTSLGCAMQYRGAHRNLSAYEEDPQTGEATPMIGMRTEQQETTLDILTGMSAAIAQGAAIHDALAEKPNLYGTKTSMTGWEISPVRSAIRVKQDYIELREQWLQGSTSHAMSWLMAATLEGLDHGRDALVDQGYSPAELRWPLAPERTETFDKDRHVETLRMLEQATIDEATGAVTPSSRVYASVEGMAREFTGRQFGPAAASLINDVLARHVYISGGGMPEVAVEDIEPYVAKQSAEWRSYFDPEVSQFGLESIVDYFARHIAEGAVRMRRQPGMYASPEMARRTPDDWRDAWRNSSTMQRIYGASLDAYTDRLHEKAVANYIGADFDPEAPDAPIRLMQHYL